jgi:hypothetical protein
VPVLLCFEGELEHHREGALPREGALHPSGAVTQRREGGLDGIGRADVEPVLGREVVVMPMFSLCRCSRYADVLAMPMFS